MKLIFAGFGGQGILTMGVVLANAAVKQGKNATWLPSYGPEIRGGTANCHVIISDKEIGSPIINKADVLVAMNNPSLEKFSPKVAENGLVLVNKSLVSKKEYPGIDVTNLCSLLQNEKVGNIIMLGFLLSKKDIIKKEYIIDAMKEIIKPELIEINIKALESGLNA